MFSRKIRGPATFDFCNNIGTSATSGDIRSMSVIWGQSGLDMLSLRFSGFDVVDGARSRHRSAIE
jgi:hypothetical protein